MNTPSSTHKNYPAESVGSRMSQNVPVFQPSDTFQKVLRGITRYNWDSVRTVYVVDDAQKLLGIVDIAETADITEHTRLESVMVQPVATLRPHADQEKAVFIAIHNDVTAVPVVDKQGLFCGAITGHSLIDIMHEEHVEDALLSAGLRSKDANILKIATQRTRLVVRSRVPWLIIGLVISMGLGLITSFFEETLEQSIALAFFIPVIAYIAGSVGAQSSMIAVRALATTKVQTASYLAKELLIGISLGLILGFLGGIGAFAISQSLEVALVVGLALLSANAIGCTLASAVPMVLKKAGKDPALGSGPMATALQDILSLLIYFLLALAIIS